MCLQIPVYPETGDVEITGPPTLTFQELITAAESDPPPPELQHKMDKLFNTPFINNSAAPEVKPAGAQDRGILRVAEWNIYRAPDVENARLALANDPAFLEQASKNPRLGDRISPHSPTEVEIGFDSPVSGQRTITPVPQVSIRTRTSH